MDSIYTSTGQEVGGNVITMMSAYFIIVIAKSDFQRTRCITRYGVSYGKVYFQPSLINTTTGLDTSFTTPGHLEPGTEMFFTVRAYHEENGPP